MKLKLLHGGLAVLAALAVSGAGRAGADDAELKAGEQLYGKECLVCHGQVASAQFDRSTRVARADSVARDVDAGLFDHREPMRLAVVPPFGPNLSGIIGRPAGTFEGFPYSANFLKAMKGTIWTEKLLDEWITDSQKRVQGVTMFYRQKDPDVRKKIIAYLKANSK